MIQAIPENRRSHRRLIIALGLSSILVASLLAILNFPIVDTECSYSRCFDEPDVLAVFLEHQTIDSISEIVLPDYEIRTVTNERKVTSNRQSARTRRNENDPLQEDFHGSLSDQPSNRDWYAIAKEPIRQSIDDYFDNEETRRTMWRQTGSVMFKDTGEFDFQEPESIIAAREFRRPVGVLGIGLTIGGCFFGIPLAGIPVEERSVGPNVFYCTDIYE